MFTGEVILNDLTNMSLEFVLIFSLITIGEIGKVSIKISGPSQFFNT